MADTEFCSYTVFAPINSLEALNFVSPKTDVLEKMWANIRNFGVLSQFWYYFTTLFAIENGWMAGGGGGAFICETKWSMSWENLYMIYANNKGADQPAHLRSLISAFIVHCLDNIRLILHQKFKTLASLCSGAGQFESYLVANTRDRFSHDMAQIWYVS